MRLLPNRLRIELKERVPVAFVSLDGRIALIDSHGVIMDMPPGAQNTFSFPVIVGMNEGDPASVQAARMKIYGALVKQLDSTGANYSHDLSEVNVSDPDDVKVTISDPKGAVLVHLRYPNFADPFKVYVAHVQEWRSQFARLDSVDLRYERQVIVNPDSTTAHANPSAAASAPAETAALSDPPPPKKVTAKKNRKH
jgi:cell division protein FtsQ